jgi:asparagine N-glycosylation enzyme membrane subunit Stt3
MICRDVEIMEEKEPDKELSISLPDFRKLGRLINPKSLLFIILILIPLIITLTVRLQPIELKMTDDWAQTSVYNSIKSQIKASLDATYPTMPDSTKQSLLDSQFKEILKSQKESIDGQISQASDYFKTAFQYQENGKAYTYLGDLDSYYYLRQARNILNTGTSCDRKEQGKCYDTFMLAPLGNPMGETLHPYAIVLTYHILHFFNKDINLMYASFYLPAIIAIIVSILAYLVARRIAGDIGGFFAAVFISTSQIFITRTLGSDTDIWNIFFPVLLLFLFIQTVESKRFTVKSIWAAITGLAFGLYSFAWVAWWFTFDLVILTYVLYLGYLLLQNLVKYGRKWNILADRQLQREALTVLLIIVSTGISVSLITSFAAFTNSPFQPLSLSNTIDIASFSTLWPNVYTTVAELNSSSLREAISTLGGKLIFFLICFGIILALFTKDIRNKEFVLLAISAIICFFLVQDSAISLGIMPYLFILSLPLIIGLFLVFKDSNVEIKYSLLLLLWMAASLYAALKGVRFVLLLIPVAGVSFGVAVQRLHKIFRGLISSSLGINKTFTSIVLFLLLCLLLISPVRSAYQTGRNFLPSISSTWADSLTYIRDNSAKDAIITSWWDFGHWFKYFAERRVTFDGASQNVPQAHWVGKALLSDDEHTSIGIIRMLNCGSNSAFELLYSLTNDTLRSIDILNQIIPVDKEAARKILSGYLASPEQINSLLERTHCQSPEDYFITSEDMISKSGVWAHFGAWDFRKSYIYNNLRLEPKAEALPKIVGLGYTQEEAARLYDEVISLQDQRAINNWVSPWPGYVTTDLSSCQKTESQIVCGYGFVLTQDEKTAVVLESAIIDLADKSKSYLLLGYIDRSTGKKTMEAHAAPSSFAITEEKGLARYSPLINDSQPLGFDVLVDTTNLRSLIIDPALTDSLFTKLYYLDGRYLSHFEKFSDKRNNIVGHHIIVWKVDWDSKAQ